VQALARSKSLVVLEALIRVVEDTVIDENGRTHNREDGRVVAVAAQTILTWGYGKPPDYDPREDRAHSVVDTSVLTHEEKAQMLGFVRRGLVRPAEPDPKVELAPRIGGKAE
jgi:hypothetical protein